MIRYVVIAILLCLPVDAYAQFPPTGAPASHPERQRRYKHIAPPVDAPSELDCTPSGTPNYLVLDQEYEECLYAWMEGLTVDSVTIPTPSSINWDGTYHDTDHLFNVWAGLSLKSVTNEVWPDDVMKAEPKWFVLDDGAGAGIEGADTLHYARWANVGAYWTTLDLPTSGGGQANPFYQDDALCRRALVVSAADMIMTDFYHDIKSNPWGTNVWSDPDARFLGGLLNYWAYVYNACKWSIGSVPQLAFEEGFGRMLGKLVLDTPGRNTPNMQTRVVPACALIYVSTDDVGLQALALDVARLWMFGYTDGAWLTNHRLPQSLVYPAGHVQEGFSPETTYNGVSLYHLLEARAWTKGLAAWNFMDAPLRQILDFRSHQIFEEPDGRVTGPSGYAGRTGDSWNKIQASHPWRDIMAAGFYREGRSYMGSVPTTTSAMVTSIENLLAGTRLADHLAEVSTLSGVAWSIDHNHHWPGYVPYEAPDGSYAALFADYPDTSFVLPFSRTGYYFSRSFGDDFWSHKGNDGASDFGFFAETVQEGGTYGGYRGGSLQSFWTEDTGLVINARHNKSGNEGVWSEIDTWGTNHVWGRQSGGAFSTAKENSLTVTYWDTEGEVDSVSVAGTTDYDGQFHPQEAPTDIDFDTRFIALADGIQVRHDLTSSGSVEVSELWATLPVYLRMCNPTTGNGNQCNLSDTTIEYWNGSSWQTLTTTLTSTTKLRLGRDFGSMAYAYVVFDEAQQVKLSASAWQQTYQSDARLRNVHISFIDNVGTTQALDPTISLSYSIRTSDT